MMNKTKPLARAGWRGCKCCDRAPLSKVTRVREARAWKRDQNVT